jgi:hypothetical protein
MKDPAFRKRLMEARSAGEIHTVFSEGEAEAWGRLSEGIFPGIFLYLFPRGQVEINPKNSVEYSVEYPWNILDRILFLAIITLLLFTPPPKEKQIFTRIEVMAREISAAILREEDSSPGLLSQYSRMLHYMIRGKS